MSKTNNHKIYNSHKKDNCTIGKDCMGFLAIDHVKTRGSGGTDESYNCMTLCLAHHSEKGNKGVVYMSEKYPQYMDWLLRNNWEFCKHRKKWIFAIAKEY